MKHEYTMATRSPQALGRKPGEMCTDFQLHKSQLSGIDKRNLFDYSELRLKLYISQITDEQQISTLTKILDQYKKGQILIAWKSGKPIWISVTKG